MTGYSFRKAPTPYHSHYIGLDEVDLLDGDIIGTIFLQEYQLKDISKQYHRMKPETLIRRLSAYL